MYLFQALFAFPIGSLSLRREFTNVRKCWHLILFIPKLCRSPKGDISKKIPLKLRSGVIFEGLRPKTYGRMCRFYLGNLP